MQKCSKINAYRHALPAVSSRLNHIELVELAGLVGLEELDSVFVRQRLVVAALRKSFL